MSWSVSAIGKPAAVAAKVAEDLTRSRCVEPEESVKQAAGLAIAAALGAQAEVSCVRVEASGHQGDVYGPGAVKTGVQNTLRIVVEPIYGFVE